MKGPEAMEIVGDLASQQWGLVTSAQAKRDGVDQPSLRRMSEQGALVRIRHGVYASASTSMSAELEVKAQWLAVRPDMMAAERVSDPSLASETVVSHTTAAEMWGIGDLWSDGIHFTVGDRRRSRQPGVRFHRADVSGQDWTIHPESGLPVTTVVRTIVDLAKDDHEPDHLLGLVADAAEASLLEEQELLDAFVDRENAFGVDRGDRKALRTLLGSVFPEEKEVRRTRSVVDQAMSPLWEQVNQLSESLASRVNWGEVVPDPLTQHLERIASPRRYAEPIMPRSGGHVQDTDIRDVGNIENEEDTRPDHHRSEE
ncbi:MAG TPA: type IV toxin-antitoxin system AbiEi family antitoxin domain-containing protein [Candidatus Corynebacterium avicola]|uniref:Type IV toxin-antitoxin system AbiEi family antitoxin domain-containing protein n=1 Tax=Candidatus Corynebacterium avicola TaxID=2838527 RepID=A0A9D1RMB9_9CORY|nr:type IV toxin-antitoxin system AbiEi family antitoxin domain-containing protein [Candidatus Corynebacterium avicola]